MNNLKGADILNTKQFNKKQVDLIIKTAQDLEGKLKEDSPLNVMNNKILAALFFEPSTRTRLSFETAMHRLNGDVVTVADPKTSSAVKGESLADSVKTIEGYADIIVLRHPEVGSAEEAASAVSIPVINAGDGAGQHPTQALLDIYTIYKEKGKLDGLTITLAGDLKYGRTIHSLAHLFCLFDDVSLYCVAPDQLSMPSDLLTELRNSELKVEETTQLSDPLNKSDILYMTRIQKERFDNPREYERLKGTYELTMQTIKKAKPGLTIMHPLPRVDEISTEVDEYKGAAYFRQAANGVPVRMALLSLVSRIQ